MGRWTQYDEDSYRLPEGVKRVAYDADTQQYTFKDAGGKLYVGPEGTQYGDFTKVSDGTTRTVEDDAGSDDEFPYSADVEASIPLKAENRRPGPAAPDAPRTSAYRVLFPFFLLVLVTLLLVIRIFGFGSHGSYHSPNPCGPNSERYRIKEGDTCWSISQAQGITVDSLRSTNEDMNCAKLYPGQTICLPPQEPSAV